MIIAKSPLRCSFFGGGTDVKEFYSKHGGAVLSAAIDKYVYVAINSRYDGRVRVSYSTTEVVDTVRELKHDIIREALLMFGVERGVEVVTIADVPGNGTGLGSSSALAVGMVLALDRYLHEANGPTQRETAQLACRIEIEELHKPIGEQDQYASARGGLRLHVWDKAGLNFNESYTFPSRDAYALNAWLLLLDTGTQHGGDAILARQAAALTDNTPTLLRMRDMAHEGYQLALKQDWESFGALLNDAWTAKVSLDMWMTTPRIQQGYVDALKAGCIGGKLLGAGGGGFMLFVVPPDKREAVKAATGWRELPIRIGVEGATVQVI